MSADGSANRSARARLRRLDSQALLPRCLGYRCPGDPSRQRRRARLPAKGVQRPPLEELNLVQRSASLRICGPRSSPALSEELTQISAARFPPATQCSHRVHTKKPGLQGRWDRASAAKGVGIQGKMPHRPLSSANASSFPEFPASERCSTMLVTLPSASAGPFHA